MLKYFLVAMVIFYCYIPSVWALDQTKILIINSDRTIQKYALAESSFNPSGVQIVGSINLHDGWNTVSEVKSRIGSTDAGSIYCIGSQACALTSRYAVKQRIFFTSSVAWKNTTNQQSYGISAELLPDALMTTYRLFFPKIRTLGLLYSKEFSMVRLKEIKKHAVEMNITIIAVNIGDTSDTTSALTDVLPKVDALWLMPDPGVLTGRKAVESIFQLCDLMNKPVFAYSNVFLDFGASLIVSIDTKTVGKQISSLVERVTFGEKVSAMIEPPAASNITLNLKKTKKYHLKVRTMAIPMAQQVIQ